MSISSCPQCARQITLPVGVSHSARVRCPLCQAEYILADAMVNVPPLLEVIEDLAGDESADWGALPIDQAAEPQGATVEGIAVSEFSLVDEGLAAEPLDLSDPADAGQELQFDEAELEHDDIAMQEQDTEVEDLGFSVSDLRADEVPKKPEPIDLADLDEESVLELDRANAVSAEPADENSGGSDAEEIALEEESGLDFGEAAPLEEMAELERPEMSFGGNELPVSEADAELSFDLEEAAPSEVNFEADAMGFKFNSPPIANEHAEAEEIEFDFDEQPTTSMSLDAEGAENTEVELDFGESFEPESSPAAELALPPSDEKKGKKKKEKKEKKPRVAKVSSDADRKSSVGTLVGVLAGALIALPLALYGMLWLGPTFDILGVGPKLPAWMVPSSIGKSKVIAVAPITPPPTFEPPRSNAPPPTSPSNGAPLEATPAAAEPASATPATEPQVQPTQPTPESKTDVPSTAEPQPDVPVEPMVKSEPKDEPALPEVAAPKDAAVIEPDSKDANSTATELPAPSAKTTTSANKPVNDATEPPVLPSPSLPTADDAADTSSGAPADTSPFEDKPEVAKPDVAKPAGEVQPELPLATGEPFKLRNSPRFTLPEVQVAMQAATDADQKLIAMQGAMDEAGLKKARSQFYLSLYRLAEVLTFTEDAPANPHMARKLIQPALVQFVRDPKRLDAIKFNAARWLAFPKRTTSGIMLAGNVQEVIQVGKLYKVKVGIGLDDPSPVITVLQTEDPQLSAGDRAFVLGSILDHPSEQLDGYTGNEATVVLSGMTAKVGDK